MAKKVQETDAHRIYGPYVDRRTGNLAWWIIPAHGAKRVFNSKLEMLAFVDRITTKISLGIENRG